MEPEKRMRSKRMAACPDGEPSRTFYGGCGDAPREVELAADGPLYEVSLTL